MVEFLGASESIYKKRSERGCLRRERFQDVRIFRLFNAFDVFEKYLKKN